MTKKILIVIWTLLLIIFGYIWFGTHRTFKTQPVIIPQTTGITDITTGMDILSWIETLPQHITFFKNFPGLTKRIISYINTNAQKPIANNVSDIFLTFTWDHITPIWWSVLQEDETSFIVDEINALDSKAIIVNGVVKNDAEIIELIRDWDKQIHTIPWFIPGTKDFSFVISPKDKNVAPWMNTYLVRAYAKNHVYYSLIKLTFFTVQQSLFDEHIRINPPSKDYWERLPKMTKDAACQEQDGTHAYDLEAKRPGKNPISRWFYKNHNILYFAVGASSNSDIPNCEDPDFEISLFTYDCTTKKSNEWLTYGWLGTEWPWGGVCHIDVIAGTSNGILMKLLYYESSSPATLFDVTTKNMQEITPFDYANADQLKKDILALQDKYSLISDWMEYLTFADMFSFENCDSNLVCDLVYERYIDDTHSIVYTATIDVINKTIQ